MRYWDLGEWVIFIILSLFVLFLVAAGFAAYDIIVWSITK